MHAVLKKTAFAACLLMAAAVMTGCDGTQKVDVNKYNADVTYKTFSLAGTTWQRTIPAADCPEPLIFPEVAFGTDSIDPAYTETRISDVFESFTISGFLTSITKTDYSTVPYTVSTIDLVTGTDRIAFNRDGTFERVLTYRFTGNFCGPALIDAVDNTVTYSDQFYFAEDTSTVPSTYRQLTGYQNVAYNEVTYTGTWKNDQEQNYNDDIWRPVLLETTAMEATDYLAPIDRTDTMETDVYYFYSHYVPLYAVNYYYSLEPSIVAADMVERTVLDDTVSLDTLNINDAPKTSTGLLQAQFNINAAGYQTYTRQ